MRDKQMGSSKMQRALGDLVLAEMFLIQATIESALAIGSGVTQLGRKLSRPQADRREPVLPELGGLVQRTADEAIEPFATRLTCLRNWRDRDI